MICRICTSPKLVEKFHLSGFRRIRMVYDRCAECGSLQCRAPTWLEEAYASHSDKNDPGALQRSKIVLRAVETIESCEISAKSLVDYGSGRGLASNLLRQGGRVVVDYDPIRGNSKMPDRADGCLCIEVLEHLMDPRVALKRISRVVGPGWLLISTNVYAGQGPRWHYLAASLGQHITFVSKKGLELLASHAGFSKVLSFYHCNMEPLQLHLFLKDHKDVRPILLENGFVLPC